MLQLQTFLTETEAILNSRPFTYTGEDINDGITLTPSHFISSITKTGKKDYTHGRIVKYLEERSKHVGIILEIMEKRLFIELTRKVANEVEVA